MSKGSARVTDYRPKLADVKAAHKADQQKTKDTVSHIVTQHNAHKRTHG